MIVVVDTNVLVSGLLSAHGAPARIIDLLITGDLQVVYDDRIAAEYRAVNSTAQALARPRFGLHPESVAHLLDYLFVEGLPLAARPLPTALSDPADQPFWEVAVEAAVPLITGNPGCTHPQRFPAEVCTGIEVLTPAAFIQRWRSVRS